MQLRFRTKSSEPHNGTAFIRYPKLNDIWNIAINVLKSKLKCWIDLGHRGESFGVMSECISLYGLPHPKRVASKLWDGENSCILVAGLGERRLGAPTRSPSPGWCSHPPSCCECWPFMAPSLNCFWPPQEPL